jgi:hypothetical protein
VSARREDNWLLDGKGEPLPVLVAGGHTALGASDFQGPGARGDAADRNLLANALLEALRANRAINYAFKVSNSRLRRCKNARGKVRAHSCGLQSRRS